MKEKFRKIDTKIFHLKIWDYKKSMWICILCNSLEEAIKFSENKWTIIELQAIDYPKEIYMNL